jgi:hypothetical protein
MARKAAASATVYRPKGGLTLAAAQAAYARAATDLRRQLPDDARQHCEAAFAGDAAAARKLVRAAPSKLRPLVAEVFYLRHVPDEAFRAVLVEVWDHNHQLLTRGYQSRTRVVAMFRAARFPLAHLPVLTRVWRGESGDWPQQLQLRWSWTRDRDTACWFATMWPGAASGQPRVLVANALSRAILMHHTGRGEDEIVTAGAIDPAIDGSPDDWWEGAARHQAKRGAGRRQDAGAPRMSNLYDTDILTWSKRQADLLRRVAAGERINDQVDWANVVEEIESVGRSEVDAVESWLYQAFLHDLKAEAWPLVRGAPAWRGEAIGFRRQARRKYRPSMRQKIEPALAELYADALAALPAQLDGQLPLPVEQVCSVTLDELLSEP